jgi:hypothetical protein
MEMDLQSTSIHPLPNQDGKWTQGHRWFRPAAACASSSLPFTS